jgi:hypothetical protein
LKILHDAILVGDGAMMSSSVPSFHPVRVAIFLSAVDRLHDDRVEMVSNDVAVFVGIAWLPIE